MWTDLETSLINFDSVRNIAEEWVWEEHMSRLPQFFAPNNMYIYAFLLLRYIIDCPTYGIWYKANLMFKNPYIRHMEARGSIHPIRKWLHLNLIEISYRLINVSHRYWGHHNRYSGFWKVMVQFPPFLDEKDPLWRH